LQDYVKNHPAGPYVGFKRPEGPSVGFIAKGFRTIPEITAARYKEIKIGK
jgi:hypothetical protein